LFSRELFAAHLKKLNPAALSADYFMTDVPHRGAAESLFRVIHRMPTGALESKEIEPVRPQEVSSAAQPCRRVLISGCRLKLAGAD
jgi:hypothetical protein